MIVMGASESPEGDKAVAAGTILDNDRLSPALGEAVGEQARTDIGSGAGSERQDEFDDALRPRLRRCSRCAPIEHTKQSEAEHKQPCGGADRAANAVAHGALRGGQLTTRDNTV